MPYAFNSHNPNVNYALNRLNRGHNAFADALGVLQNITSGLVDIAGGLINGAGAVADTEQIEAAVQWAVSKAGHTEITYSWVNRNLKNPDGLSYDCSSFIITAFYAGGIDVNANSTADMVQGFTALGWKYVTGTSFDASVLRRGDILIDRYGTVDDKPAYYNPDGSTNLKYPGTNYNGHTQMYIGEGQDVNCGNANPEILVHSVDNFGRGWSGILIYDK